MDSVTSIVTALTAGAVAGLQPTVSQEVKDSYATLKALIQRKYKYRNVNIDQLEVNPSEARRAVVKEDLQMAAADQDEELLQKVKKLLDAVQNQPLDVIEMSEVDREDIQGASLTIADMIATQMGVRERKVKPVVISRFEV